MSEIRKEDKVKLFIDESFRLCCTLAKEIALIRYRNSRKLMFFGKRELVTAEEFRAMVLKEFEDGIKQLPKNTGEDLEAIAKNAIADIKNGSRPKLQKMIEDSYNQLLKETGSK